MPMTADGPDVAELERVFAEHRPRLYLTSGGLQNPTGATPSAATVHRVLRLAEEHDVLILEDDTFADFEAEPSTRLAALDGLRRVVQVGSATKAVGAAMRCGYIAAREDWIAQLVDLKLATTMGNSATGAAHSASRADGKRIPPPSRRLAAKARRRHGADVAEPAPPRPRPLDRAARRHLCVGALARGRQRRRRRPPRADEEGDVRARAQRSAPPMRRAAACASTSPAAASRASTRSSTKRSPPLPAASSAQASNAAL